MLRFTHELSQKEIADKLLNDMLGHHDGTCLMERISEHDFSPFICFKRLETDTLFLAEYIANNIVNILKNEFLINGSDALIESFVIMYSSSSFRISFPNLSIQRHTMKRLRDIAMESIPELSTRAIPWQSVIECPFQPSSDPFVIDSLSQIVIKNKNVMWSDCVCDDDLAKEFLIRTIIGKNSKRHVSARVWR